VWSFDAALVGQEIVVTRSDSYNAYHGAPRSAPEVVLRVPVRGTQLIVEPYGPGSVTHDTSDDGDTPYELIR
jgi:hypothetical protein